MNPIVRVHTKENTSTMMKGKEKYSTRKETNHNIPSSHNQTPGLINIPLGRFLSE